MKKTERHQLMKELVRDYQISNQETFVELLAKKGVTVTQATISRDINELNLLKNSQPDGSFYYCLMNKEVTTNKQRLTKLLSQSVVSLDLMDKYLAIKTVPGSAVALGILLESDLGEKLFTNLTTDDKVLLIFKSELVAQESFEEIKKITR